MADTMKPELAALALSVGFKAEAIKKWRQRGHVPPKHCDGLLRSARRRRLVIDEADFVFTPTKGTGTSRMVHIGALTKNIVRRLVYLR